MQRIMLAGVALATFSLPVLANDTTAQLGTGGLIFVQNYTVQMLSEDLYVSPEEVRVKYEFKNTADTAEHVLVAFPMPDIAGSGDFMVAIPTDDTENLFGFETTFNGEAVDAELHQYAFAAGIDQSEFLRSLDVPLAPFGMATYEAINALDDADKIRLQQLGLVMPMEFDDGSGMQTDHVPIWTLRSTYSWEAEFPAGEIVIVEHSYKPSVGGTVALTYLGEPYEDYDPQAEYLKKYCTDAAFIKASKRKIADAEAEEGGYPTENWISYVWSTGANWYGSIGKFTLTIDKGDPENLVSFCWDGDVEKISDTAFRMEATDWYPPYDRELEILIAVHGEPVE